MYSTCLHCTRPLGANAVIETLPIGRRLAFDADKGRLWVVCRECAKWNLVPFDTRLESIETCERLYRDTATRYSTGTIGLAKVKEGLELVRIGPALLPEFASWRYGEQYRRRRRQAMLLAGVGGAAGLGAIIGAGAILSSGVFFGSMWGLVRGMSRFALDRKAKLELYDPELLRARTVRLGMLEKSVIHWPEGVLRLSVPRGLRDDQWLDWEGEAVDTTLRRVTGSLNLLSGSRRQIDDAIALRTTERGDVAAWLRRRGDEEAKKDPRTYSSPVFRDGASNYWEGLGAPRLTLAKLPPADRLMLEMWLAESSERRWLDGELALLEREWREAEKLAKIADDLSLEPAPPSP